MAAARLASPGTDYGPCKKDCKHIDCAETRKQAATHCFRCWMVIGYEVRFYRADDGRLVHAVCEERHAEASRT